MEPDGMGGWLSDRDGASAVPTPEQALQVFEYVKRAEGLSLKLNPFCFLTPENCTGYAVADGNHSRIFRIDTATPECVYATLRQLSTWLRALELDGTRRVIGGWPDGDTGDYLLGLTVIVECPAEARRLAEGWAERFVYAFDPDLGHPYDKPGDVPVSALPRHPRGPAGSPPTT